MLKEIRLQLNKKEDNIRVVRWIRVCCRLHNWVMDENDEWEIDEDVAEEPDSEELLPPPVDLSDREFAAIGKQRLVQVQETALQICCCRNGVLAQRGREER